MEMAHLGRSASCVLIVEDDDDVREFMELLVSSSGYQTMTARDGQEALLKMRQRKPCLVLLDLQMPRMDGWEFRELTTSGRQPQTDSRRVRHRLFRPRPGHAQARLTVHSQAGRLPFHPRRRRGYLRPARPTERSGSTRGAA